MNAMTPTPDHICGTPNAMCDCSCYQREEDDMTPTPETLRTLGENLVVHGDVATVEREAEAIGAAADAWKAQLDKLATALAILGERITAARRIGNEEDDAMCGCGESADDHNSDCCGGCWECRVSKDGVVVAAMLAALTPDAPKPDIEIVEGMTPVERWMAGKKVSRPFEGVMLGGQQVCPECGVRPSEGHITGCALTPKPPHYRPSLRQDGLYEIFLYQDDPAWDAAMQHLEARTFSVLSAGRSFVGRPEDYARFSAALDKILGTC